MVATMEQQPLSSVKNSLQGENQLQLLSKLAAVKTPSPVTIEEAQCLKELRKLIKEDEFVRESGVGKDEELLLAFVRGKRCNVEKAFKCLKNHTHVVRVKYVKFFKSLSPRKFKYLVDGSLEVPRFCGMLKHTDLKGRRVGLAQCSLIDHSIHKVDDVIAAMVCAGLELLRTEDGPKNGFVIVVDGAGFGFRHAREFSMTRIYMFLTIFLSAYPVMYKGFHILNNAYLFDTILLIVKQLIPKKLRERIHLHGSDFSKLHNHVPREILPESFGGPLTEEEAYDLDFERTVIDKADYYEKLLQSL